MSQEGRNSARHIALLAGDAPVLNRCGKEEAHLKQRLAQSTATYELASKSNQATMMREQRIVDARLNARFGALLSDTTGLEVPSLAATSSSALRRADAAVAQPANGTSSAGGFSGGQAARSATTTPHPRSQSKAGFSGARSLRTATRELTTPPSSGACLLGFPDAFENSGFKSVIRWASVAYDETFLAAYGPRRTRETASGQLAKSSDGSVVRREAQPHRLLAAVACYLLNEVLCADSSVSELWQQKLRQPIFDAVFSSQSIAMGQDRGCEQRGLGTCDSTAVADAIVSKTVGPGASTLPGAADDGVSTLTISSAVSSFPPRTNTYTTRDDFASLRLWTEEVAMEQQEKASVCQRVRNLQHAMARRQLALHLFQRRAQEAELRAVFAVWRSHTQQRRANRGALNRYFVNHHNRYVEETIFLRWRRFTLRAKVEALQRRVLNIAADRDRVAAQHAAALQETQEQLNSERRRHVQEIFERETLNAQVLDSHGVEVDALRLMLQMERHQTAESGKWARRWQRVAKTFRPAKACPSMPGNLWAIAHALQSSEETFAATVLRHDGDRHVFVQMPYSLILPAQERMEQLLLEWVNVVMEASPQASTWVNVDFFMHGHCARQRGIMQPKIAFSSRKKGSNGENAFGAGATAGASSIPSCDPPTCDFSIYTLMCLVRELRRCYVQARLLENSSEWSNDIRMQSTNTSSRFTAVDCFQELAQIFAVQTCGGLFPPLLTHCPSVSTWFTPDGVFSGPMSRLEGTKRQQRQQYTAFMWILASLLVGHIQIMWMSPWTDRGTGTTAPPQRKHSAMLYCTNEAAMSKFQQINIPTKSPARRKALDAAVGTTVVAHDTVHTKTRGTLKGARSLLAPREVLHGAASSSLTDATAANELTTLEAVLRARSEAKRGSHNRNNSSATHGGDALSAADDTLSDVEAFLGMMPAQVHALKGMTMMNNAEDDNDDDEDWWVNGLLHQLFEAEDAEARQRRNKRLKRHRVRESHTYADKAESSATCAPLSNSHGGEESDETGSETDDPADANDHEMSGSISKNLTSLTGEQLRLLRSLPGRSRGFDALRPIVVAASQSFSRNSSSEATNASVNVSAAPLYSFLLNTLDDAVARQQWCGLARVLTSLLVRFRVLDDSEDAVRRAAAITATKEQEASKGQSPQADSRGGSGRHAGSPTSSSATRLPPVPPGRGAANGDPGRAAPFETNAGARTPGRQMSSSSPVMNRTGGVALSVTHLQGWSCGNAAFQTPDVASSRMASIDVSATPITSVTLGEELRSRPTQHCDLPAERKPDFAPDDGNVGRPSSSPQLQGGDGAEAAPGCIAVSSSTDAQALWPRGASSELATEFALSGWTRDRASASQADYTCEPRGGLDEDRSGVLESYALAGLIAMPQRTPSGTTDAPATVGANRSAPEVQSTRPAFSSTMKPTAATVRATSGRGSLSPAPRSSGNLATIDTARGGYIPQQTVELEGHLIPRPPPPITPLPLSGVSPNATESPKTEPDELNPLDPLVIPADPPAKPYEKGHKYRFDMRR